MIHFARPKLDRRAFTLIELLVVVAIIALLLAILVPSLGRARDQARKVNCQSNLHQIHTAMTMYLDDHRQVAFWRDPDPNNGMDWYAWGGTETGNPINAAVFGTLFNRLQPRPLNPYVDSATELFHCPGDLGAFWHDPTSSHNHFEWLGNSYNFNSIRHPQAPGSPGDGLSGVKLSRVEIPFKTVLFYEAGTAKSAFPDAFEWHPVGTGDSPGNFVMVDGSSAFMPLPAPTDTTWLWNATASSTP